MRSSLLIESTTATSRTRLWPASGWGCRDRRLSRSRGNPDRQRGLSRRLPAWHRLFRFADGEYADGRIPHGPTMIEDVLEFGGGNLTLRGQMRPVTVQVTLNDGRYTGEATVKQTDFGIKLPEKRALEPKTKSKLSSTCGWHRKTRGPRQASGSQGPIENPPK
jgi:hypothetical protein